MQVKCFIMGHTEDRGNVKRLPRIRMVTLPEEFTPADVHQLLETVFYYGQNDFAIGPELNTTYSLSTSDVVSFNGRLYLCMGCGWKEISGEQFKRIRQMSRRDRIFLGMKLKHCPVDG